VFQCFAKSKKNGTKARKMMPTPSDTLPHAFASVGLGGSFNDFGEPYSSS
jgi:hypothetical protein